MRFNNLVTLILDNFKDGIMQDDKGIKRSVEAVVKFAEQNKDKYFKKDFPIKSLEHDLKWWDKQNAANKEESNARMMKADTSYPLLVIKNNSYGLSVSDGLNRLKKARDVENKTTIDVYVVPEKDIPDSTIVESKKEKRRLDPKCWKGYRKAGTKLKDGTRVNKCIKVKK
jgi:hypothetical protein